jgi:Alpha-(1,6)-fucosyltransferase N- and catalytic domains
MVWKFPYRIILSVILLCLWRVSISIHLVFFQKYHHVKESQRAIRQNSLPKYFMFKMGGSGLGSQLINLFAKMIYLRDVHNRQIIVDESQYGYRKNASVGVLTGYFSPKFKVIDTVDEYSVYESLLVGLNISNFKSNAFALPKCNKKKNLIWITGLFEYRRQILKYYNVSSLAFFESMVKATCPSLELNQDTLREVERMKDQHGLPKLHSSTAAFHVRRTDKLDQESILYRGEEYVTTLLKVSTPESFKYCYIATDDRIAIVEIRSALQSFNVTCQVYALHNESLAIPDRSNSFEALRLITEISILSNAAYFVGTFNSNIGAIVTILRSCNQPELEHYGRSYAVDTDLWFLP